MSHTNDILEDGSVKPVDKSELPIMLPDDIDLKFSRKSLENHPTWKKTLIKTLEKALLEKLIP